MRLSYGNLICIRRLFALDASVASSIALETDCEKDFASRFGPSGIDFLFKEVGLSPGWRVGSEGRNKNRGLHATFAGGHVRRDGLGWNSKGSSVDGAERKGSSVWWSREPALSWRVDSRSSILGRGGK
jgi:hypothetical protein